MTQHVLLTGATGLIGQYLVRNLLRAGVALAVIVRPSKKASPKQRIERIVHMWERFLGQSLPRPVCLSGDLSEPGLDLSADDRKWVSQHCDRVIHNAAYLSFASGDETSEVWRINYHGTKHVLDFCRSAAIDHFHYVSTAYVCGDRQGLIREDELDEGQDFRNDYEKTKFLAEREVRSAGFPVAPTIYRPVVVTGDSQTGYTCAFNGVYFYLRLLSVLHSYTPPGPDGIRHLPIRLRFPGDQGRNLVPVDWAAEVLCHLFHNPEAHGKTFHLAGEEQVPARKVVEAGSKYLGCEGIVFDAPRDAEPISELDKIAQEQMTIYQDYDVTDPEFDKTNLRRFAGHLPCPKMDEAMLALYLRFGQKANWGRKTVCPDWLSETIVQQTTSVCPTAGNQSSVH